jgi:uncharacterized membrane protein YeaQ/YmgE (transglycosylase-associated protein family)
LLRLLIALFVVGVAAGYLARLLVMGRDPMTFWQTVLLGVVGSFIGGTVGTLVFAGRLVLAPGGLVLAIPGAVAALLLYRRRKYGSIMPDQRR